MSKIFRATLESKKTQHPEGEKSVVVIVSDKMKKDAINKAQEELKFWDADNHELYKNPKMEELDSETGEQALIDYLAEKEAAGQASIEEHSGELETDGFDPAIIRKAILTHPDYINCANPYDVNDFISTAMEIVRSEMEACEQALSSEVVGAIIEQLPELRCLYNRQNVIESVIAPAVKTQENTKQLAESAHKALDGANTKLYDVNKDYSKKEDRFIEVSKYKLNEQMLIRLGVGHLGGKFFASYDVNLIEKEIGTLNRTHGNITSFASQVFSERENAINYAFGMAIDYLLERAEQLNKNLMRNDAKMFEQQAAKLSGVDFVELFEKNKSSTQLDLIPALCDMPLGYETVMDNDAEKTEPTPFERFVSQILSNSKEQATPEQVSDIALTFDAAFDELGVQLMDGEYYSCTASEIMNACRGNNLGTLRDDLLQEENVLALVEESISETSVSSASNEVEKTEMANSEVTKSTNYCNGLLSKVMTAKLLVANGVGFSISVTDHGDNCVVCRYDILKGGKSLDGDRCQMPSKKEALIFAINRIKCTFPEHCSWEHQAGFFDNALKDPIAWFDCYAKQYDENSEAMQVETKPQPEPETKPTKPEETQPLPKPETKPFKPQETKAASENEDDIFEALGFTPENEKVSEAEPEKTQLEKQIEAFNNELALEPGEVREFTDLPNLVYHGSMGVSSSKLKDACISLMYYNGVYNTGAIEKSRGKHFDVGNLAHTLILEPEMVEQEYKKKPDTPEPTKPQREKYDNWVKLGKPSKADNPKAYPTEKMMERCEFWDNFTAENENIIIVGEEDWKVAEAMAEAVRSHEFAGKILNHSRRVSERSYFKVDEETGLLIKVRPDIEVDAVIADVKTIQMRGNPDEEWLLSELRREVKRRKYHVSAAMYLDVTDKKQFVWIFVNKEPGYHWVAVVKMSEETRADGHKIYRDKLNAIKHGYETNVWPAPCSIQKVMDPATERFELPEA